MSKNSRVVVIGGGYAGVMAANRVTQRNDVDVTLINARSTFVERIRLHQLVGGSNDAVVDYREVLADRVQLVVDSVEKIVASERRLELEHGDSIAYDYLIYAVGSHSAEVTVSGASTFAYPLAGLEQATKLQAVMATTPPTAPVVIVGAGPSGIETAAELSEQGRNVTLVSGGELGPYLHPRVRGLVSKRLLKLGVKVLENTTVTAVTRNAVELGDGSVLPSAVTIWTAGFSVPDLAFRSGLSTDAVGRLLTDETLTSVDDERIVAAGDSAAPSNMPFRMSCQAAGQLGMQAADTVVNRIAGEAPKPLRVAFLGQCISLGREAGVFQFSTRHDEANSLYVSGRTGAKLKEIVCKSTVKQLVSEGRKPGSFHNPGWIRDDKRTQLLEAQHEVGTVGKVKS